MARTFSTQVVLTKSGSPVTFGPGDEVPSWAPNVGEHVLHQFDNGGHVPGSKTSTEDLLGEPPKTEKVIAAHEAGHAPDFTKPAPTKRGPGRPRKTD